MADAADSKSVGRKAVWVRLPPPAPQFFGAAESFQFYPPRLSRKKPQRDGRPLRTVGALRKELT
jgi:hypothetical protein